MRGDVVEEEERLGAGREHVVDAVRGEVGAARRAAGRARRARTASSRRRRSRRRAGARSSSAIEPGERRRSPLPAPRRLDGGAEPLDDRVGGRERDAGRGVGPAPELTQPSLKRASSSRKPGLRRKSRGRAEPCDRCTMRSTGVHHVDLVVSSIERSLPFYRELLGPLGWHRRRRGRGRARRDDLVPARAPARSLGDSRRGPGRAGGRTTATAVGAPPPRARGRARARPSTSAPSGCARRAPRSRTARRSTRYQPGVLRGVLLRSRRAQAGDRPRLPASAA